MQFSNRKTSFQQMISGLRQRHIQKEIDQMTDSTKRTLSLEEMENAFHRFKSRQDELEKEFQTSPPWDEDPDEGTDEYYNSAIVDAYVQAFSGVSRSSWDMFEELVLMSMEESSTPEDLRTFLKKMNSDNS